MFYDAACRRAIESHANAAVPWLLISTYLANHHGCRILSDEMHGELARYVVDHWAEINHVNRDVIDINRLSRGAKFSPSLHEYPEIAISAANRILTEGVRSLPSRRHARNAPQRPEGVAHTTSLREAC